jgi:hypothetical protein
MNITKEVYSAHRELSQCSAAFLEYVSKNPGCLKRSNFSALLSADWFDYVKFQPWPTFISKKTKDMMETAAVKVYQLITSIPERLFGYDAGKMVQYYGVPGNLVKLMLRGTANGAVRDMLSRGDFIFSPTAGLKCVEFNMVSNIGGGWQTDAIETLYFNTPVIAGFLEQYQGKVSRENFFAGLLEYVIDKAAARFSPKDHDEINMAIVLPKYVPSQGGLEALEKGVTKMYQQVLQRKNSSLGGELIFCDFLRLKVVDNHVIFAVPGKNKRIHILVEKCNGMVPVEMMNAVEAGNLLLFNGPISHLMSNKLNLALLSERENSDVFSPAEREVIKKYIPWTRRVIKGDTEYEGKKVELGDFILSHRERLLLKPGEGIGGYGVYPGCSTPPDLWKQQVEKALEEKNWVVQEYIPSFPYLYQQGENGCAEHHVVWGFFVYGSQRGGGYIRLLPVKNHKGVINASQGAQACILMEVDES